MFEEAVRDYQTARQKEPNNRRVMDGLGKAERALKVRNSDDARVAVKMPPPSPFFSCVVRNVVRLPTNLVLRTAVATPFLLLSFSRPLADFAAKRLLQDPGPAKGLHQEAGQEGLPQAVGDMAPGQAPRGPRARRRIAQVQGTPLC